MIHRFVVHQRPEDAVARLENVQAESPVQQAPLAGKRLVPRIRLAVGVGIPKRDEGTVVELLSARGLDHPDDVVLLGALKLKDTQLRPGLMDAVFAFGVAFGHVSTLSGGRGMIASAVVHAVHAAVPKNIVRATGVAFPRLVENQCDLPRLRVVKSQLDAVHPIDQVIVDHQFPSRTDRDRLIGRTGLSVAKRQVTGDK